ncbi:MAG: PSD1 and planctomycete cytochrome C domain-containing protein [Planctomycetota bacterium]
MAALVTAALPANASAEDGAVDFNAEVRPIFVKHCLACHGGVKQAGSISFVTRELAMAEGDSGISVIEPGDHQMSYLFDRVSDADDDTRMPPPEHGRRLNEKELAILARWIDTGAEWADPWSFQRPKAPPLPDASSGARSTIDRFVFSRLAKEGLEPAPEADRLQWLRRVSFDLTGLPPTEADRRAFLADKRDEAYERVVERLLASPHYGERLTSLWLDLARYADTMGFEKDPDRTIWPYRDWLIRAFNADKPYDEFLLEQIAGDLLENATIDQRLATAMHRNTQTNTEGGTDDEEYRWAAIVDRVDSTGQALLGMTMGCARCHDHPYDPITQRDYYRFAAFFNTTQDNDLVEDLPKLAVPEDRNDYAKAEAIDAELSEVRQRVFELGRLAANAPGRWTALPIDRAESTGETRLVVRTGNRGVEVVAEGTITDRSLFNLASPAPVGKMTALRIDALPKDLVAALKTPVAGFILSQLRVFVERADAEASAGDEELLIVEVFADEAEGFFPATESIREGELGWGAYTRMRHPRWAVFVLDEPVELAEGDRLRIEIKHGMATDGQEPLVIQRLVVSTTDDPALTTLADSPEVITLREREQQLVAARDAIPSVSVPVFAEQPDALKRQTHLYDRGNWLSPGERLDAATPEAIPGDAADRLALGHWLGSDDNPLAARVMVNRLWAALFGGGLVETLDDFGSTGTDASHPQLLDHLAVRFRDDFDWSIKRLLREVVLSATYRQDAKATPEMVELDPGNRLLARGPRGRLTAEMVRDQALVLSGRFNPKLGGPPVMPYQPDGVWQTVYNNRRWEPSEGDDRYRRAIYTFWKRTAAYPSMVAFDAPSREQCTAVRPTTNTPLQALVTLNDPAFVELAEGLAERMLARDEPTAAQIAWAAREATGGELSEESLGELVGLFEELMASEEASELFAMTVVANVILNLDATLTK